VKKHSNKHYLRKLEGLVDLQKNRIWIAYILKIQTLYIYSRVRNDRRGGEGLLHYKLFLRTLQFLTYIWSDLGSFPAWLYLLVPKMTKIRIIVRISFLGYLAIKISLKIIIPYLGISPAFQYLFVHLPHTPFWHLEVMNNQQYFGVFYYNGLLSLNKTTLLIDLHVFFISMTFISIFTLWFGDFISILTLWFGDFLSI